MRSIPGNSAPPTHPPVQIVFGAVSFTAFCCLGYLCFKLYGWEFVQHTYLHHAGRLDFKHSFSPHFYPSYLSHG